MCRSLALTVVPQDPDAGIYYVFGGYEPHWVSLYDTAVPRCDCYDHVGRERVCKHLIAVLARVGDMRLYARLKVLAEEADTDEHISSITNEGSKLRRGVG